VRVHRLSSGDSSHRGRFLSFRVPRLGSSQAGEFLTTRSTASQLTHSLHQEQLSSHSPSCGLPRVSWAWRQFPPDIQPSIATELIESLCRDETTCFSFVCSLAVFVKTPLQSCLHLPHQEALALHISYPLCRDRTYSLCFVCSCCAVVLLVQSAALRGPLRDGDGTIRDPSRLRQVRPVRLMAPVIRFFLLLSQARQEGGTLSHQIRLLQVRQVRLMAHLI
jgi:hypothetical protein